MVMFDFSSNRRTQLSSGYDRRIRAVFIAKNGFSGNFSIAWLIDPEYALTSPPVPNLIPPKYRG